MASNEYPFSGYLDELYPPTTSASAAIVPPQCDCEACQDLRHREMLRSKYGRTPKRKPTKKKFVRRKGAELEPRLFWWVPTEALDRPKKSRSAYGNDAAMSDERRPATEDEANIISSILPNGNHAPVLDLDFPARLVPSSTPGHFHLYLDVELSPQEYRTLLETLAQVGIVEEGYAQASVAKGMSMVRKEGVLKPGANNVPELTARMEYAESIAQEFQEENQLLRDRIAELEAKLGDGMLTWK